MAYVTDLDSTVAVSLICHRPVALFCFLHCEYSPGALAHVWHRTISSGTLIVLSLLQAQYQRNSAPAVSQSSAAAPILI